MEGEMTLLPDISHAIVAIGAVGTAAFGLVDATKVFWGGINHVGFSRIRTRVSSLMPTVGESLHGLTCADAVKTLKAHWFNGSELGAQKSLAKTLIKLHLNVENARALAAIVNLDPATLTEVATKLSTGLALDLNETGFYERFETIIEALLDESYEMADQAYKNGTRALAMVFAAALAIAGACVLDQQWIPAHIWEALLVGLLATPLAPIAKDLSTTLSEVVSELKFFHK
jgi:hypothetical protein